MTAMTTMTALHPTWQRVSRRSSMGMIPDDGVTTMTTMTARRPIPHLDGSHHPTGFGDAERQGAHRREKASKRAVKSPCFPRPVEAQCGEPGIGPGWM